MTFVMVNRFRLPRGFLLLHPSVGWLSIPAALVWFERRNGLPRLPGGFLSRLGLPLVFVGVGLSSWTALSFVFRGEGTPDPNNPPRVLVQDGPYRYSRNPMAAGGVLTLLGVGLLARSLVLVLYVVLFAPVLQLYHVWTEEPELVERFGEAYLDYRRRVPRWLPGAPRPIATG